MGVEREQRYMRLALSLAERAARQGEVPVGAVVVSGDEVIGTGYNRLIQDRDPTAHAEVVALRDACTRIGNYRLPDAELYVTIEPCTMCAGALVHARIRGLVVGALEPRAGVVVSQAQLLDAAFFNHKVEVTHGVLADEAAALLRRFFQDRRG